MKKVLIFLFVVVMASAAFAAPAGQRFTAHLSGDEEVPARDTDATGQATFWLSKDGTELAYKLIVANIENVTQSHIHCGAPGSSGPPVVWLYPSAPPAQLIEGRSDGILGEGVITDSDIRNPACGSDLSLLLDSIRRGDAYVNVHTTQFPPGEIRGQIEPHGPHS